MSVAQSPDLPRSSFAPAQEPGGGPALPSHLTAGNTEARQELPQVTGLAHLRVWVPVPASVSFPIPRRPPSCVCVCVTHTQDVPLTPRVPSFVGNLRGSPGPKGTG